LLRFMIGPHVGASLVQLEGEKNRKGRGKSVRKPGVETLSSVSLVLIVTCSSHPLAPPPPRLRRPSPLLLSQLDRITSSPPAMTSSALSVASGGGASQRRLQEDAGLSSPLLRRPVPLFSAAVGASSPHRSRLWFHLSHLWFPPVPKSHLIYRLSSYSD
jgi:hypothetical protein